MLARFIAIAFITIGLAGCVTIPNKLSVQQVEILRFAGVQVGFADDAHLWWGDAERAYAASKGIPVTESETIANTPEARAYVKHAAAEKIGSALQRHLKAKLAGQRPVRVNVIVRRLEIASIIQRIIIGGQHQIVADVTVVDAKSGAPILDYPSLSAFGMAGQGLGGTLIDAALLPDPIDRLTDNFATLYSDWLLPSQPM